MGIKLIYHDKESTRGGTSPFDKAIIDLVKNKNICIICPYIGRDYFSGIIQLANTWHLVTDIGAWMRSHNQNARQEIKNFIIEHPSNIHHYKDIHAKVIINDNSAFIGSANLTEKDGRIPISINQRWILKPLRPYYKGNVGLIMPLDYDSHNYNKDGVVFDDEGYFFRNKICEARWLGFERKNKIEFSERIKNYWKKAAMEELKRGKVSGRRDYHKPVVYEAVMNLSYRNKLLEEAFSKII